MQDITDVSTFTDPVPGLQDIIDSLDAATLNLFIQALANRTRKLKDDQAAHAAAAAPHSGHETPDGAQIRVDAHNALTSPHSATATPIGNRLAKYDASGRLEAIAGIAGNDVVNFGQFLASKAVSGYQKLPSGLIVQWGSFTTNAANTLGFPQLIALPITFPSALVFATASEDGGAAAGVELAQVDWATAGKTTTSQLGVYSNYTGICRFFSIGY